MYEGNCCSSAKLSTTWLTPQRWHSWQPCNFHGGTEIIVQLLKVPTTHVPLAVNCSESHTSAVTLLRQQTRNTQINTLLRWSTYCSLGRLKSHTLRCRWRQYKFCMHSDFLLCRQRRRRRKNNYSIHSVQYGISTALTTLLLNCWPIHCRWSIVVAHEAKSHGWLLSTSCSILKHTVLAIFLPMCCFKDNFHTSAVTNSYSLMLWCWHPFILFDLVDHIEWFDDFWTGPW